MATDDLSDDAPAPAGEGEADDSFYRGRVLKLLRGSECGTIRSASGRDIPFVFQFVSMLGPHRRFTDLREGMDVGYDVSWTANGLRVSVIRIPD